MNFRAVFKTFRNNSKSNVGQKAHCSSSPGTSGDLLQCSTIYSFVTGNNGHRVGVASGFTTVKELESLEETLMKVLKNRDQHPTEVFDVNAPDINRQYLRGSRTAVAAILFQEELGA